MTETLDPTLDLVLERDIAAPRALVYSCWTTPEHLMQWFVPKPHKVTACHLDVRVGGAFNTTFDVDGTVMDNHGVYLEIIPQEKLVFTDAYGEGWWNEFSKIAEARKIKVLGNERFNRADTSVTGQVLKDHQDN